MNTGILTSICMILIGITTILQAVQIGKLKEDLQKQKELSKDKTDTTKNELEKYLARKRQQREALIEARVKAEDRRYRFNCIMTEFRLYEAILASDVPQAEKERINKRLTELISKIMDMMDELAGKAVERSEE